MNEEVKSMTAAELDARDRVVRMIIMLKDVAIVDLDGGVCWPFGSFQGGQLVKNRDGKYWLCNAYAMAEGRLYDRLELPVEAVAAAILGSLKVDDFGYDSVELCINASTYDHFPVHPGELGWWTVEMRDKVLAMNECKVRMKKS